MLLVLCICRISGDKQDRLSLEDQSALLKEWGNQRYDGLVEFVVIAGVGSGEVLDRKEAIQIEEEVASGKYDLVIAEDLGRIYRRLHALLFCETCLDQCTRVVAINDQVDTANEGWKMTGFFAVMRHESYNFDTAKRIRRTQRNRFINGGIIQTLVPGYIKPPGAKSDSEIRKDPDYESVYQHWFELLEGGASYSEVADWLNENRVPRSPYARASRWTVGMVTRITHNTILKGVRQRNNKISIRVNKTGRRKQVKASPSELLERQCPHLVFVEPARYDRILKKLDQKNAHYRRKLIDGRDPRTNVSKKRTRWPGQHLYCGCCGAMLVYGAHGQTENLICSAAKEYRCWMGVSVNGPKAREKLCAAILQQLETIPEFDSELLKAVVAEATAHATVGQQRLRDLQRDFQKIELGIEHFAKSIEEFGASATLMANLRRLEDKRQTLLDEQQEIQSQMQAEVVVPTAIEVRQRVGTALVAVAAHDPVAMRLLHGLISKIVVFPFRSVDGGHPVLRANFDLNFAAIDPLIGSLTLPGHPWHVALQVDLFDPPKRREIRGEVQRLQVEGLNRSQIAQRLRVTLPVVQQAINLQKQMDQLEIDDPYQPLAEPPANYSKLRRHRHKRFRPGSDPDDAVA